MADLNLPPEVVRLRAVPFLHSLYPPVAIRLTLTRSNELL